jgi:Domain of unknown function (DUF4214)
MNNFNSYFPWAFIRLLSVFTALASTALCAQTLTVTPASLDFGNSANGAGQYSVASRRVFPSLSVSYTNNTTSTISLLSVSGGPAASAGNNTTSRFTTSGSCYSATTINAPLRASLAPGTACSISFSPNIAVLNEDLGSLLGGYLVDDTISLITSAGSSDVSVRARMGNDLRFYVLGGALEAEPSALRLTRMTVSAATDSKGVTFVNPYQTGTSYTDTINFVSIPAPFVRSGGTCPSAYPAQASLGCTMIFSVPANALPASPITFRGTAVIGFARANRAIDLALATGIPAANSDNDGDGIPFSVEIAEGRDPDLKDNAIFAGGASLANRWFAMQQYRDFLGREADAAGLADWTNRLATNAMTREEVIQGFFGSPEFQAGVPSVVRLYLGFFNRIPDSGGLKDWVTQLRAGTPIGTIASAFTRSQEFQNTYGALTNSQFITLVYRNVLGRAPDAAGFADWSARLAAGLSRGDMMVGFTESTEFQLQTAPNVFVIMMYEGLLRRAAEQAGYEFWVSYVNSGKNALDLTRGFLNSQEYRNRFLP